jgi:hypothetical protein
MNASEGMRRFAAVVRFIGTLIGVAIGWGIYRQSGFEWWVGPIAGGIVVVAAWALAWIIDGFAAPPKA